jgi:hypothetical protein
MIFDDKGPHAEKNPGGEITRRMIEIYAENIK